MEKHMKIELDKKHKKYEDLMEQAKKEMQESSEYIHNEMRNVSIYFRLPFINPVCPSASCHVP